MLPASNVMPPGIPGRVPYNPLSGHVPWSTDPARARALLTQAGKLGFVIAFPYAPDNPSSKAVKNVIVPALTEAGFDPRPVAVRADKYGAFQDRPQAPINVRNFAWGSDWPSGSASFPALFQTTHIDDPKVGFANNFEAFSSSSVDARIGAITRLLPAQQPAAWNALDKFIQTRYFPLVVTGYGGTAMMRGSKVHDAVDDPTIGMPTWKNIWVG
jgi:peptide/nickel transport system substrate-binding protein